MCGEGLLSDVIRRGDRNQSPILGDGREGYYPILADRRRGIIVLAEQGGGEPLSIDGVCTLYIRVQ
jgi:hypothetical protein